MVMQWPADRLIADSRPPVNSSDRHSPPERGTISENFQTLVPEPIRSPPRYQPFSIAPPETPIAGNVATGRAHNQ